ncbi:hypothetical protein E3P81_00923 [Wallemia ichthyophaga]|uniref:Uncharacterized protein n=1 Tax=Wallemia ichthyophaga TaxID=245174 RepID=A0A4T0J4K0_WALIC|nr:hypothetical protein E3P97_00924 [Wallemia ichthyophaga]TIB34811.1 hypothetical protein E3P85_00778 [Wallemia ichthyophaga]TIB39963.1 hypothetical protein E3P86_00904 [Wallemia ichthyophaga]TIB49264.1 hypothetical protein E3P82_00921 [Wallemia ichthyophaga]TIB53182.1 hypothetical protein E3P81_00923 [Wallemia ichthyophaga]
MEREGSYIGDGEHISHNPRLSRLLQNSPSMSTSPTSSLVSSSAASIFERDIEPAHPIHTGFLGSREATDLSTAPALTEAFEAFVGSNPQDSIGVEMTSNVDWGSNNLQSSMINSPSQSLILPPPSPPTQDSALAPGIQSSTLPASPPNSPPPPTHQPQTSSPLNPLANQSPRLASQSQSLGSTSPSPNLLESPGACHRISLLSYGDVITERPTSAVPLQTALNQQSPPQSHLLNEGNEGAESSASPAANYVEERNREVERAALSKGLEARLEALSFPEPALTQNLPPMRPSSRNVSPVPPVASDLPAPAPSEERYIEEKETVTERGAERLSHRIQSLAV